MVAAAAVKRDPLVVLPAFAVAVHQRGSCRERPGACIRRREEGAQSRQAPRIAAPRPIAQTRTMVDLRGLQGHRRAERECIS